MESDISFSLCSDQALVESKQCLVDFIHIVVSPFDKIFYNDIEFARTGKGKPCLTEHLLHLGKRQFQSQGKCQHRRFGWLIEFIRTDLREEFPVNVCLLVTLGIRHAAFINLPQQHFRKALIHLSQCLFQRLTAARFTDCFGRQRGRCSFKTGFL